MSLFLLGILLFSVFGIVIFSTQGFGGSINTPSDVNPMGALEIIDSSGYTLTGIDLGTADDISSITLTFETEIPNNTAVNISLKDGAGIEIGTGSITVSPTSKTVVISLTGGGIVTAVERDTLRAASITVA